VARQLLALRRLNAIRENTMLAWTVTFLIIAIVAALLGFAGIAGAAAGLAKIIFYLFLILFVISLVFGSLRPRPPH